MLLCRMVDQRAVKLRLPRPYATAIGCEASRVAAAIDLQPQDVAVLPAPNAMIPIARGARLSAAVSEVFQNSSPVVETRNGELGFPLDKSMVVMGGDLVLSMGLALGYKLNGRPHVVLVIANHMSASSARWQSAMAYAGGYKLPLLLLVESPPNNHRPARPVGQHDDSTSLLHGFPRIPVLGCDAVAIYRVTREAVDHARKGYGPTLIECQPWFAPKPNQGSRSLGTPISQPTDPLRHMELYMKKHAAWDDGWQQRLLEAHRRDIQQAFAHMAR